MAGRAVGGRVISFLPVLFGHVGHGMFVAAKACVGGRSAGVTGGTLGDRIIPMRQREGMTKSGGSPGGCSVAGFTVRAGLPCVRVIR